LNSIYAKQESDKSNAIEEMNDIFKLMEKNNSIFPEDEKVKYLSLLNHIKTYYF